MLSINLPVVAAALSAMLGLATASCQLSNAGGGGVASDATLCVPQGEGDWTFAMSNSAVDVPAPGSGGIGAGYSQGNSLFIFDNACNIMGEYAPCSGGTPYTIEENFLADVLTVSDIDMDLGGGYFKFYYGNGEFTIGNNGCTCQDDSSGLQGSQGCKCAFPQDGVV